MTIIWATLMRDRRTTPPTPFRPAPRAPAERVLHARPTTDTAKRDMTPPSTARGELSWLLDDLLTRASGTQHAIVLSTDGLLMATSSGLDRPAAEHLSAIASGLHSLAGGASKQFSAGDIRQSIIEMDRAFLFVAAAGDGACMALMADADSDVGLIAYEMNKVIERVGQYLSAPPRPDIPSTPAHVEK